VTYQLGTSISEYLLQEPNLWKISLMNSLLKFHGSIFGKRMLK